MKKNTKTTYYISNENIELLDTISFLRKESKTNLVNNAITYYLNHLIASDEDLKDKVKNLKK